MHHQAKAICAASAAWSEVVGNAPDNVFTNT